MSDGPTIAQLFNPAPLVEQGLQGFFKTPLKGTPAFVKRETAELPAEYITITFEQGAATARSRPMPDGTLRADTWNFRLKIALQTVRVKGQPDQHPTVIGKIREIVNHARYSEKFLAWHVLMTLDDSAQPESIMTGEDSDLSVVVFTGTIGVKHAFWPVA